MTTSQDGPTIPKFQKTPEVILTGLNLLKGEEDLSRIMGSKGTLTKGRLNASGAIKWGIIHTNAFLEKGDRIEMKTGKHMLQGRILMKIFCCWWSQQPLKQEFQNLGI